MSHAAADVALDGVGDDGLVLALPRPVVVRSAVGAPAIMSYMLVTTISFRLNEFIIPGTDSRVKYYANGKTVFRLDPDPDQGVKK